MGIELIFRIASPRRLAWIAMTENKINQRIPSWEW